MVRSKLRMAALALAVLAASILILVLGRGEPRGSGPAAPAAPGARRPAPPSPRPVRQQPRVALAPAATPALAAPAPAGALEGRVVSASTGEGIAGAQLTFARPEETSAVASGPGGAFRFEARVPGRWTLAAATAPAHQPFAPDWGQSPVSFEARPGEVVRGITLTLLPEEVYEGRAVDDQGRPVDGAEITVLGGGAGEAALVPVQRHRSDAAGAFRFTAPEDAVVLARREGYLAGRARVDAAVELSRKLTVRLRAATAAAPALAIEGVVEDAGGGPVEGACVTAAPVDRAGEPPAAARTDARGRFRIGELEAGRYAVAAARRGAAPASAEVEAGATGVRLRLEEGGALAGRVRARRGGAPVTLFTVLVQGAETRSESCIDPEGRYALAGLPPGPAVVSVLAPGFAPSAELRVVVPGPGAAPATADFELSAGGRLTGVVRDRVTARPISGARVVVEGAPATLGVPVRNETTTDAEGRFELAALAERPVGVTAAAPGHHARVVAVPPVPEGEARGPIAVDLSPTAPGEDPRIELVGIGAGLEKRGEVLRVTLVAPGGGAAEAGLAPGDEILEIDGAPVSGMTLGDAIPLLRGAEGTSVSLRVRRPGAPGRAPAAVVVPRRLVRG